jgi:hypothetical protein
MRFSKKSTFWFITHQLNVMTVHHHHAEGISLATKNHVWLGARLWRETKFGRRIQVIVNNWSAGFKTTLDLWVAWKKKESPTQIWIIDCSYQVLNLKVEPYWKSGSKQKLVSHPHNIPVCKRYYWKRNKESV